MRVLVGALGSDVALPFRGANRPLKPGATGRNRFRRLADVYSLRTASNIAVGMETR